MLIAFAFLILCVDADMLQMWELTAEAMLPCPPRPSTFRWKRCVSHFHLGTQPVLCTFLVSAAVCHLVFKSLLPSYGDHMHNAAENAGMLK